MKANGTGAFEFKSWDEKPYAECGGGPKLTCANVENTFDGAIEGRSRLMYLLTYLDGGAGAFVGYEQIVGRIGDREGSFVLRHEGSFNSTGARATFSVVPGSGTDSLAGLSGVGEFESVHGRKATPYSFEYDLA